MKFEHTSGGFTLPGESGQEKLTLELAKKWGADVIRDSDGTQLSDEILNAGYDIYSTICIIRDHNTWAKEHPECLQQSFLSTEPVIAAEEPLTVKPMAGFFDEQFKINDRSEALRYWQVWDRTANKLLPADTWQWDAAAGTVTVASPVPFHAYTVSFLAWRTWEEINMYNHVTNSWTSEHLLPVDPRTKEAQDFLYDWLKNWCETHPQTNVVRFTSMFYNFVWIWGSDKRNQNLFTDWGSYDFTVSEKALDDFAAQLCETMSRSTGAICAVTDRDSVIAVAGGAKRELLGKPLSDALAQVMEQRSIYQYQGSGRPLPVSDSSDRYTVAVAAPILCEGDVLGLVLFLSSDAQIPGEGEYKLAQTVAAFLGKNMEN